MKPLTAIEANKIVGEILIRFTENLEAIGVCKQIAVVTNVQFSELIHLFGVMQNQKRQIYLPGEIDNENLTIIYTPVEGCTIAIESEPCVNFRWKVKQLKFNMN